MGAIAEWVEEALSNRREAVSALEELLHQTEVVVTRFSQPREGITAEHAKTRADLVATGKEFLASGGALLEHHRKMVRLLTGLTG